MPPAPESRSALAREIRTVWPSLTYHYGLTFADLRAMPRWARIEYMKALPRLRASDQLAAIEAVSFPNMEKAAQSRALRRLERQARVRGEHAAKQPKTVEDMKKNAAAVGISFETVKADESGAP